MVRLRESTTGEEIPAEQGKREVGYGKPPEEHQFKPGQSGNPAGPPKRKTQLWVYFCKYMNMTDAEIEKLDKATLTQSQHSAMNLRDIARNGKSGFIRLALAILDREEGKARQDVAVEGEGLRSIPVFRSTEEEIAILEKKLALYRQTRDAPSVIAE